MKPPAFEYYAPIHLPEALEVLGRYGAQARLLAGGQSLMPMLNLRLARPAVVLDLNRIKELAYIETVEDCLVIGAMTRQRTAERSPVVLQHLPLLAETLSWIGHVPIRNRGTIGGSLALAHPAAELPALAKVLDAQFVVRGADGGTRQLSADDFFVSSGVTALRPDEMLTEVRFPFLPSRTGCAIHEVARRQHDLALVGVIATVALDEAGRCADVRLGLFGVADTPIRATAIEQRFLGQKLDPQSIQSAIADLPTFLDPSSDIHASAAYRREVALVLAGRAVAEAVQRAGAA